MQISEERNSIMMRTPDDWHFHFRQGPMLPFLVKTLIENGWRGRVGAEPNTTPPKLTGQEALDYCGEITDSAREVRYGERFEPVPIMQITEQTRPETVREAFAAGVEVFKVYPRYVTTNSENGVVNYEKIYPVLAELQEMRRLSLRHPGTGHHELVVQFHAETPREEVDGLYKEEAFLTDEMAGISREFPELPVTIEHISSAFGTAWILEQPPARKIAAGITIQHLINTQDDVLGYSKRSGGLIRVHDGFKPQAKLSADRAVIQGAVLTGNPRFFYAGDGAWHPARKKECRGGSCGAANTLAALPLLVQFFEEAGELEKLEPFVSEYGARFYGYPLNEESVSFVRRPWTVPEQLEVPGLGDTVVPWRFGETMPWKIIAA